jgi:hypothetical protein
VASGTNVSLTDVNAIQFGGASTVSGNLTVSAVGISEAVGASLAVTGTSAFNAGAGAITLANAGNDFTGAVSLSNSGANAVQITDTNAIVLGTVNTANNLTVNAVGITQNAGGITVGGTSTFNAGAGGSRHDRDDFTGAVTLNNSGRIVAIIDANDRAGAERRG